MSEFKLKLSRLHSMPAQAPFKKPRADSCTPLGGEFNGEMGFGRRFFDVGDFQESLNTLISSELGQALLCSALSITCCTNEDLDEVLFLDTETTGLGYGAGTYAFLVGLTYRVNGAWVGEQLFLNSPSEESMMLRYLTERLGRARLLITYNGKSYDLPLLNVRMTMHRLARIVPANHIDLYHTCRGILKHRLERFRLCDLEAFVLGFVRDDDIAGADIPAAYFAFLHGRDEGQIAQVIRHNEFDVVSMVRLLDWLSIGMASRAGFKDQRTEYGFSERLVNRNAGMLVLERLGNLLHEATTHWVRTRCALLLYEIYRHDDLERAMNVLIEHYGQAVGQLRNTMAKRLAIHFEHHVKDCESALVYAEETEPVEGWCGHRRRINRLHRKMTRQASIEKKATSHSFARLIEVF